MNPLLRHAIVLLLALPGASAFAQAPAPLVVPEQEDSTTALPIIRNNQVEGFLLIESGVNAANPARSSLDRLLGRNATPSVGAGVTFPFDGGRRLSTSLALETNPTIGLLCNGNAESRSFGALAQHCMLANLAPNPTTPIALARPGVRAEARLDGNDGALSASLGLSRFDAQAPLAMPGAVTSFYAYEGGAARNAVLAARALPAAGGSPAVPAACDFQA